MYNFVAIWVSAGSPGLPLPVPPIGLPPASSGGLWNIIGVHFGLTDVSPALPAGIAGTLGSVWSESMNQDLLGPMFFGEEILSRGSPTFLDGVAIETATDFVGARQPRLSRTKAATLAFHDFRPGLGPFQLQQVFDGRIDRSPTLCPGIGQQNPDCLEAALALNPFMPDFTVCGPRSSP